ncbi:site-specific DNA-methyltransferase [Blautia coccoides]|uniref:site-specific DNA-methyltransferase n=1 Tax=Blautia producta TaxID=33035 RepID=UPI002149B1FD|nr:site-specific DNA-methyltransferase [Blautia coccoides]MCR1986020.1 site-specific DNA-methyltransferase [Blautia coccoides]
MPQIKVNWEHNYVNDCIPNFTNNMDIPRHRWYEFKEGFGHTLVERAIADTRVIRKKKNLTVLDPFSGSGTTPLTALQNNCNAIGLEVNPFMNFIGKTKSTPLNNDKSFYESELEEILNNPQIEIDSILENISTFTSNGQNEKWLFNKSVLRGFEALNKHIDTVHDQDLFRLALYTSVMQCCNAKKDGKCLRYKKGWDTLGYSSIELRNEFERNAVQIINDMAINPLREGNRNFINKDSRKAMTELSNQSIDLIVFSPPYLNSFDYSDIYRPELFLGGYVKNNSELRLIRKETLRSHVQYKWEKCDKSQSIWAQNIANQIRENKELLWNKDIPEMIDSYFYDMEQIFKEAYRVAEPHAQLWFVIATSAYAGIEVPVDLILADIATKQGWNLKNVNALRKLRTSSQCSSEDIRKIRLRESLIICEK